MELGRVRFEPSSKTYVLWLKDTFGVTGPRGGYVRADEYHTMAEAETQAVRAPCVFIWHLIWMRGVVKREAEQALDDRWDEIEAATGAEVTQARAKDRVRASLDRLRGDKIPDLFEKAVQGALTHWIIEAIKKLFGQP